MVLLQSYYVYQSGNEWNKNCENCLCNLYDNLIIVLYDQRNSYVERLRIVLSLNKTNNNTIMTFSPTLSHFDSAWGGKRRGTSRTVIGYMWNKPDYSNISVN